MLASSAQRILAEQPTDALILDVGGWASPFSRADVVLDLMPYATRGLYGSELAGEAERFSSASWVERDICDREPWPFADDEFDFVICSHTLEDVRDPLWVCSELNRVAKAGYVEVPSRLHEQSYGIQGPWVGWGHHHWLIDVAETGVEFVFKPHIIHGQQEAQFSRAFGESLSAQQRVSSLWWTGSFSFAERLFFEPLELDAYLAEFVAAHEPPREPERRGLMGRIGVRR